MNGNEVEDVFEFMNHFVAGCGCGVYENLGCSGVGALAFKIGKHLWTAYGCEIEGKDEEEMITSILNHLTAKGLLISPIHHVEMLSMGLIPFSDALRGGPPDKRPPFSIKRSKSKEDKITVTIHGCPLGKASQTMMEAGIEVPLCPFGAFIVTGLEQTRGIKLYIEKIMYDPEKEMSTIILSKEMLTTGYYSPLRLKRIK